MKAIVLCLFLALMSQVWAEPLPSDQAQLERMLKDNPGIYQINTVIIEDSGNSSPMIEVDPDNIKQSPVNREIAKDLEPVLTYFYNNGYLYNRNKGKADLPVALGLKPMPSYVWNLGYAKNGRDSRKELQRLRHQRTADIELGKMIGALLIVVCGALVLGIVHELRSIRMIKDGSWDRAMHDKKQSESVNAFNTGLAKLERLLLGKLKESEDKLSAQIKKTDDKITFVQSRGVESAKKIETPPPAKGMNGNGSTSAERKARDIPKWDPSEQTQSDKVVQFRGNGIPKTPVTEPETTTPPSGELPEEVAKTAQEAAAFHNVLEKAGDINQPPQEQGPFLPLEEQEEATA